MPLNTNITEVLQRIQDIRRKQNKERIEKRWLQVTNSVPNSENEEENLENIENVPENIPENNEMVQVSWLNRPRVFNNGWMTNLNVKEHVKIKNNGGEIT